MVFNGLRLRFRLAQLDVPLPLRGFASCGVCPLADAGMSFAESLRLQPLPARICAAHGMRCRGRAGLASGPFS